MQSFKTTVTYLHDILPNINEETFSARLKTLNKVMIVLKQTEKEVKESKNFTDVAQKLDLNMRRIGLAVEPSFRRDVETGQELLQHIQQETGRMGESVQLSFARISFDVIINSTTQQETRYTRFSDLYE